MQDALSPPNSASIAAQATAKIPATTTAVPTSAVNLAVFALQRRWALWFLLLASLFVIYGSWLPFDRNDVPFSDIGPMLALWWQQSMQGLGLVVSVTGSSAAELHALNAVVENAVVVNTNVVNASGVHANTVNASTVNLSSVDVATNVLLAVPLGFFAASMQSVSLPSSLLPLSARQTPSLLLKLAPLFKLVPVLSYALLLALLVEIGQLFLQARVASVADVLAQLVGAGLGAVVAWRYGAQLWPLWLALPSEFAKADIWYRLCAIYAVLFLLYNGLPFDITINPEAIYDKYKAGLIIWQPIVYHDGSAGAVLSGAALWYAIASDFLVWLPLAGMGWLALGSKRKLLLWVLLYAISTEVMQLFIRSRTTDVSDVLYALLAVGLVMLLSPLIGRYDRLSARAIPAPGSADAMSYRMLACWVYLACFVWALCYAAVFCYPYQLDITALRQLQLAPESQLELLWQELPFFSLYQSSLLTAISTIIQKIMFAVPFGVALAVLTSTQAASLAQRLEQKLEQKLEQNLAPRLAQKRRWAGWLYGILWTAIIAVVLLVEISQLFIVGKVAQLLDVLLVLLAVWASYIISRSFLQARQRPMHSGITRDLSHDMAHDLAQNPTDLSMPSFATHNRQHAYLSTRFSLAVSLGVLWCLLWGLLSWAGQQAALPYNVRELLGSGELVAAAMLSLVLMITLLSWPLLLIWQPRLSVLHCGVALIGQSLLLYTLLLLALPVEVLHDVVGSPTWWRQGAGSYVEMALRFSALLLMWQIAQLLFWLMVQGLQRYLLPLWLVYAPIGALLWWLVVVYLANTDNIIELLAPDALWFSSLLLWLWMHLLMLACYWLSRVLGLLFIPYDGSRWPAVIWRFVAALSVLWLSLPLLETALASHIYKYGQQFSALQFLLSPDRQQYMLQDVLSQRYYAALSGLVLLLLTSALWIRWLIARRR